MKKRSVSKNKKICRILKSYHAIIVLAAFTLLSFTNISHETTINAESMSSRYIASTGEQVHSNTFIDLQKPRQSVFINTSYEKLSDQNHVRVLAQINSQILSNKTIRYQWTSLENSQLVSDPVSGALDLSNNNEIQVEIAITDNQLPAKLRLQVFSILNGKQIGSIKEITINAEDIKASSQQRVKAQGVLSKEEAIRQELNAAPSWQPRQ